MNVFVSAAAATPIPLAIGFVWYHDKVFGKAWAQTAGLSPESLQGRNMGIVFGLTLLFSYFIALFLGIAGVVIHQAGVSSLMAEGSPELSAQGKAFIEAAGHRYNTYKHGAFHGVIAGLFFAMPVVAINALFERRGAKYVLIHTGYWTITLAAMGAVICQFTDV